MLEGSFRELFLQFPFVFIMTLNQHMMNNQSLLNYIPGNCTRLDFLSFNVFSDASSFRKGRPWVLGPGEFIIFRKGGRMMCKGQLLLRKSFIPLLQDLALSGSLVMNN